MTAHATSDRMPVMLYVPLRRNDGKPDNSPLQIAATLNGLGFRFTHGHVVENHQDHESPHVQLMGSCPKEKFIPGLLKALGRLAVPYIDSDEDADAGIVVAKRSRKLSSEVGRRTAKQPVRKLPDLLALIDGTRTEPPSKHN